LPSIEEFNVSKSRAKSSGSARSKFVWIPLAIGLVGAGGLVAYGISRPDPAPGPTAPPAGNVIESPANGQPAAENADTRGTADIALPPVPPSTTTP
jgi:hypothetical protein